MKFKGFALLIYFIVLIVVVILGVIFAQHNSDRVIIDFWGQELPPYPLWIIILVSSFVGFILGVFIMFWKVLKVSIETRKYKRLYKDGQEQSE